MKRIITLPPLHVIPSGISTFGDMDRRTFLSVGGVASTLLLAACGSHGPESAQEALQYATRKNEQLERVLFRHSSTDVARNRWKNAGKALPSYFVAPTVPVWDPAVRGPWTLEITGLVARPIKLTLADLQKLPRVTQRVNHYCVEGWTAVETWTGVRMSEIAGIVGVQPGAAVVDFRSSFDIDPSSGNTEGYHESWDIESAMHRQTLIAYGLDGQLLGPAHGAPARVYSPVKLGYKNTKYLTQIVFTAKPNGGYWSDRGYEWYGGV